VQRFEELTKCREQDCEAQGVRKEISFEEITKSEIHQIYRVHKECVRIKCWHVCRKSVLVIDGKNNNVDGMFTSKNKNNDGMITSTG
jgi:hypothetical protein